MALPESTLQFDSQFESGNLKKAIRVDENEYNLLLDCDVGTDGHTQWFYFSVTNYKHPHVVRFNIINLAKNESSYTQGLKPLVYSSAVGSWSRATEFVTYTPSSYFRTAGKTHFQLSFTYTFSSRADTVFFAHCYPYTYSDLTRYLRRLPACARVDTLCKTFGGRICPMVTITDDLGAVPSSSEERRALFRPRSGWALPHSSKKFVVLTARVHAGETNSSHVMEGVLEFLTGDSEAACVLRKHFVFKIVPMLNPDGVVSGNSRCSLPGADLNRQWRQPSLQFHPTIYYTKRLLRVLQHNFDVVFFCDFHGHSVKQNAFIYGCAHLPHSEAALRENLFVQLVPALAAQASPWFSWPDSRFRVEPSREGTGRVVAFKELKVLCSYTLETSFFGARGVHMTEADLRQLGREVIGQLRVFVYPRWCAAQLLQLSLNSALQTVAEPTEEDQTFSVQEVLNSVPEVCHFPDGSSSGSDDGRYAKRPSRPPTAVQRRLSVPRPAQTGKHPCVAPLRIKPRWTRRPASVIPHSPGFKLDTGAVVKVSTRVAHASGGFRRVGQKTPEKCRCTS